MRHRIATLITMGAGTALVLSLLLASAALASGPVSGTRGPLTAVCGGSTYTVAVVNRGQNIGAVQVVDAFGHAILVDGKSTVRDTTADILLDSWTSGHGGGHANQTQTECISVQGPYTASDLYGTALPFGVSAGDSIVYTIDFMVVLKV